MRFREALARLQSFRSRFEGLLASARQNGANARATRTLPTIKRIWQSVEKLTSGAFTEMWRERVESLYALYTKAVPGQLFMTFSEQSTRPKRRMLHGGFRHVLRGRPVG
jgi:hypothetical protein